MIAFLSWLYAIQALDVSVSSKRVIFVKRPAVGFNESSWTLVSELTTQPARKVANPNPPNHFTSLLQEKARKCTHRPSSTITERMGIAARVPRQPNLECLPRRTGIHDWMTNWEYLPRFPFRTGTSVFTCYKFSPATSFQAVCFLHSGIMKKNRPSCAFALHQNGTLTAKKQCSIWPIRFETRSNEQISRSRNNFLPHWEWKFCFPT